MKEEAKYNEDNLEKEAPSLFRIPRSNPFSVPAGYFDTLEKNIMDEITSQEVPLEELTRKNSFTVPEGYFDTLPMEIRDRIAERKIIRLRPSFALAVAACFVMVLFITRPALWFKSNPAAESVVTLDDLNNAGYLSQLDENAIIEAMETQELASSVSATSTEFEDYLIDNNIDIHQLTNEL